jgi:hypothetical protein
MVSASPPTRLLDVGVAFTPLAGENESGDLHLVCAIEGGVVVAVVDGLGHGQEAAVAARIALATIERHATAPLPVLVERCHGSLLGSRGVVMSVAQIDANRDIVTWVGLGNVKGVLVAADHVVGRPYTSLVTRSGIVGNASAGLPPVRPWVIPIQRRDILVLATDGVRAEFGDDVNPAEGAQHTAEHLLKQHSKGTDDALVLVARYLGRR